MIKSGNIYSIKYQAGISGLGITLIVVGIVVVFAILVGVFFFLLQPAENANVNQNVNNANVGNLNQNVNTTTNQNANTNLNTNAAVTPIDADQDGLADAYEPVYRALATMKDTDQDGFSDAVEIFNGYKPNTSGMLFKNDIRESLIPKTITIKDLDKGEYIEGQIVIKFRQGTPIQQALDTLIANDLAYIPLMFVGPTLEETNTNEIVLYPDSFSYNQLYQLQVQVPAGEEQQWVDTISKQPLVESAKLDSVTEVKTTNTNQ